MGRYAAQTTVPVERTRAEIEETLRRAGKTRTCRWGKDNP